MASKWSGLTSYQERSIMPQGIYKGYTIGYIIKHDPKYLAKIYKQNYIKLSGKAATLLKWSLLDEKQRAKDRCEKGSLL